jgi:hypothetical protein
MTKYLIENHAAGGPIEIGPADGPSQTLDLGRNTVAALDAETFHRLDATEGVRVTRREPEHAASATPARPKAGRAKKRTPAAKPAEAKPFPKK